MKWMTWIMVLVIATTGCGKMMTPDSDDMSSLEHAIAELTRSTGATTRRLFANDRANEDLKEKPLDDVLLNIKCGEHGNERQFDTLRVYEMLVCLQSGYTGQPSPTFAECVEFWLDGARSSFTQSFPDASDPNCITETVDGFAPDRTWDPEQITDDDLARSLIASKTPPKWLVVLGGAAVLIAAPELFPVLCGMSIGWACQGNPQYPGTGSTSGGSP